MNGTFVTYYRVSTDSQGVRGLGMDAQRKAVENYLNGGSWTVVREFEEVESGSNANRPQLMNAIALCKATGAKLLIAKIDRLARDLRFLTVLDDAKVEFVSTDMPDANRFTINIMMAMAQQEREMISARTKAGLASIKDRIATDGHHVSKAGNVITKLGRAFTEDERARGPQAHKAKANARATKVAPAIVMARGQGMTLQATADHLNSLGLTTPRGSLWTPIAVSRAEKRV